MSLESSGDRKINYMRISVTDRCNFRCNYCMPDEGVEWKPRDEIMSYEEIIKVAEAAGEDGIKYFRLTGGEPLARLGIEKLIDRLDKLSGCEEISLTTNGYLLAEKAEILSDSGLERVNISLDTLDPDKFRNITGIDGLNQVFEGIEAAKSAGLDPVKLNVVALKDVNTDEIESFAEFARDKSLNLRFIEYMPFYETEQCDFGGNGDDLFYPLAKIYNRIEQEFDLIPDENIKGRGPAKNYQFSSGAGALGFISPISGDICKKCNRLRLTADGYIRPCLASEIEFDLFEEGELISRKKIKKILSDAASNKNLENGFKGSNLKKRNMSQIGG